MDFKKYLLLASIIWGNRYKKFSTLLFFQDHGKFFNITFSGLVIFVSIPVAKKYVKCIPLPVQTEINLNLTNYYMRMNLGATKNS